MSIVYVKVRTKAKPLPYEYKNNNITLKRSDIVVVESNHGTTYGLVSCTICNRTESRNKKTIKKILRIANENDLKRIEKTDQIEHTAHQFCKEQILGCQINMKLVDVESSLNGKKLIFYFISEKRVDFRELVKIIAAEFRARIEMVQIGVRDQARRLNGCGPCGAQLCCNSFIERFEPITIKMVKDQNISLNPSKISGLCGRLMCCLAYEHEPNGTCTKKERKKKAQPARSHSPRHAENNRQGGKAAVAGANNQQTVKENRTEKTGNMQTTQSKVETPEAQSTQKQQPNTQEVKPRRRRRSRRRSKPKKDNQTPPTTT